MALFETKNLSFTYPDADKKALNDINLSVNSGDFILLMGKSGSGKSTLLRLFTPQLSPHGDLSGEMNVNALSAGFVLQNPELSFVSEKVRGELAFALENQCLGNDEISLKIGEIASFFDINEILDSDIASLSGGEKAIVSIAAAMIADVQVLLLDEPTAQLDAKASKMLADMLKRINDELGVTVIISSHASQDLVSIANRMLILDEGKVICDSAVEEAVKNDSIINFFPPFTAMFESRPITVKQAIAHASELTEKPIRECDEADDAAVEMKNICFAYSKNSRDVLNLLSYTAYKGKINSIIGANASGKTTLLKVIAGIKRQYHGKIMAKGKIAYMPQNVKYLFTKDAVSQEISYKTAQQTGIADCFNRHPFDLSGGQAQRLAFGILIEQNPDIFLLDEPTKAYDYYSKQELKAILKSLCDAGKTVIMVSHDLDFVGEVSDYVAFLSDSAISIFGKRRKVLSSLNYYTTQIRRITRKNLNSAVSQEDLE